MSKEIKYPIGIEVKVCNNLETIIEKVEWIERLNEYQYWFKDENGKLCSESEEAIECACPPLVACEICGEEKNLDGDFWKNKKKHDC